MPPGVPRSMVCTSFPRLPEIARIGPRRLARQGDICTLVATLEFLRLAGSHTTVGKHIDHGRTYQTRTTIDRHPHTE